MSGARHTDDDLPEQRASRRRHFGLDRGLLWLIWFTLAVGVACYVHVYDGTMRGFLNSFAILFGSVALVVVVMNRLEALREARAAMSAHPEEVRAHRAARERPSVAPKLRLLRWLVLIGTPTFVAGLAFACEAVVDETHERAYMKITFILAVLSMICGAAMLSTINRRIQVDSDRWRAARRNERHPELVAAERRAALPGTPLTLDEESHDVVRRKNFEGSRLRRRPPERARIHATLEWTLVVFLAVGLPSAIYLLGPAQGLFSFVAIAFVLMAITNRVDTWASEKIWTPGNPEAEQRRLQRIENGSGWWASEPPRLLRNMRRIFLTLVVTGFFVCLVWPYLRGWAPDEKYPYAAVYVGGFVFGLALLATAERHQIRLEREWLKQRRAERSVG
ncbi:MAG: hypothetical protein H6831_04245 [Planctomycetes bacterium]|nr:hypothetical protein [Planctomycetota bacterium]MCB9903598.1 hypothetical protein [Planctomycetota bacterium]